MKLDNKHSRERKVFYCLSGASWFLRILALLALGVAVSLVRFTVKHKKESVIKYKERPKNCFFGRSYFLF